MKYYRICSETFRFTKNVTCRVRQCSYLVNGILVRLIRGMILCVKK